MNHAGLGARIFAWVLAHSNTPMERIYGGLKDELFAGLEGQVLEIGPGAGINLRHYPRHIHLTGVEPNRHMHKYLRSAAEAAGIDLALQYGAAESLGVESGSMDAVVSTLVLCSVDDVPRTLAEVRRVLRPGGRFYFIEHVAAPEWTALCRTQNLLAPVWRRIGDGCHPNRATGNAIHDAGFGSVQFREERLPGIPLVAPHIIGVATN